MEETKKEAVQKKTIKEWFAENKRVIALTVSAVLNLVTVSALIGGKIRFKNRIHEYPLDKVKINLNHAELSTEEFCSILDAYSTVYCKVYDDGIYSHEQLYEMLKDIPHLDDAMRKISSQNV